jgi:hypothetical protein
MAERAIKSAWEGSEAMRKEGGGPAKYWSFSLLAFVHTRNLLAMGEEERSPHELWEGIVVPLERRLRHLRVWGAKCYPLVPRELRKKLDDKARVCVFVGYSDRTKGYLALELATGKVITAVSVVFDETQYPFKAPTVTEVLPRDGDRLDALMRDALGTCNDAFGHPHGGPSVGAGAGTMGSKPGDQVRRLGLRGWAMALALKRSAGMKLTGLELVPAVRRGVGIVGGWTPLSVSIWGWGRSTLGLLRRILSCLGSLIWNLVFHLGWQMETSVWRPVGHGRWIGL